MSANTAAHPRVHHHDNNDAPLPPHKPESLRSPVGWADLHPHEARPDPSAYAPGDAAHEFVRKALGSPQFFDSEKEGRKDKAASGDPHSTIAPITASGHRAQLKVDGSGTYTVNSNDKLGSDFARAILQDRRQSAGISDAPTARDVANFGKELAVLNGENWDRTLSEGKLLKVGPHRKQKGEGDLFLENERKKEGDKHNEKELSSATDRIGRVLKADSHDFKGVFKELDQLREKDGNHIAKDLKAINNRLHEDGLLRKDLNIIRDDRHGEQGWAVISEDQGNKELGRRNRTMVSTSHDPHQSDTLKHQYQGMHYRRGHYSGWHQSVEGGGGAHGGFDKSAVGGHVPDGARRELIEKALKLAGVPVTEQNIAAVNKIVTRESGWNPNITNNWDSNAKAGHPSTGLMQTIPSTFKAFALPGMNNNIHDPLSNLVAGIRYAEKTYGRGGVSGVARVASRPGGY